MQQKAELALHLDDQAAAPGVGEDIPMRRPNLRNRGGTASVFRPLGTVERRTDSGAWGQPERRVARDYQSKVYQCDSNVIKKNKN